MEIKLKWTWRPIIKSKKRLRLKWRTPMEVKADENQIKEAFINGGRGHPPSHLKFFLLVFSKLKEEIK